MSHPPRGLNVRLQRSLSGLQYCKARLRSRLTQLPIGTDECSSHRPVATPDQRRSKPQTVRRAQRVKIEEKLGLIADCVAWGNFVPFPAQVRKPIQGY